MTRLKNEVAIITGGAGDIGSAHVESFVREGANVIIADINEEKGNLIAKKIQVFLLKIRLNMFISTQPMKNHGRNYHLKQLKNLEKSQY